MQVTPPKTIRSFPVVGDHLIDTRISLITGIKTKTIETVLLEPRREGPGKTLESIRVLLLVRDRTHSRADSVSPHCLVHPIFQYFGDPAAKNPAVLSTMDSDSREKMANLALTQCDSPQRTIQSMEYPTSAR